MVFLSWRSVIPFSWTAFRKNKRVQRSPWEKRERNHKIEKEGITGKAQKGKNGDCGSQWLSLSVQTLAVLFSPSSNSEDKFRREVSCSLSIRSRSQRHVRGKTWREGKGGWGESLLFSCQSSSCSWTEHTLSSCCSSTERLLILMIEEEEVDALLFQQHQHQGSLSFRPHFSLVS